METYVILTKLSADSFHDPAEFPQTAHTVAAKIKAQCPDVVWKESYALMGRFDVLDVIEAPSRQMAEQAAMLIRAYGHATTETLAATPWKQFLRELSSQRETTGARR